MIPGGCRYSARPVRSGMASAGAPVTWLGSARDPAWQWPPGVLGCYSQPPVRSATDAPARNACKSRSTAAAPDAMCYFASPAHIPAENPAKLQFCSLNTARSASILQICSFLAASAPDLAHYGQIDVVLQQFPLFGRYCGGIPACMQEFLTLSYFITALGRIPLLPSSYPSSH